jgi:exodeoxyribonuclease V alpha subunit
MIRVRAGISYALTEAMDEGHCGLPTDELVPLAEKLLEVPQQLIRTAVELELQEGTVVADRVGETPCVFLAGLYRKERTFKLGQLPHRNRFAPHPASRNSMFASRSRAGAFDQPASASTVVSRKRGCVR